MKDDEEVVKFDPIPIQFAPSSESFLNLPPNSNRFFAPGISESIQTRKLDAPFAPFKLDSNPVELAHLEYNKLIGHYIHEINKEEYVAKDKIDIAHFNSNQIAISEIISHEFNKEEKQDIMRYVVETNFHKTERTPNIQLSSNVQLNPKLENNPKINIKTDNLMNYSEKKFCANCGSPIIQKNSKFCSKCGKPLI